MQSSQFAGRRCTFDINNLSNLTTLVTEILPSYSWCDSLHASDHIADLRQERAGIVRSNMSCSSFRGCTCSSFASVAVSLSISFPMSFLHIFSYDRLYARLSTSIILSSLLLWYINRHNCIFLSYLSSNPGSTKKYFFWKAFDNENLIIEEIAIIPFLDQTSP